MPHKIEHQRIAAESLGELAFTASAESGERVVFSSPQLSAFLGKDRNHLVTFVILRKLPVSANVDTSFASKENASLDGPRLELELEK